MRNTTKFYQKGPDNQKKADAIIDVLIPAASKVATWTLKERAGVLKELNDRHRRVLDLLGDFRQSLMKGKVREPGHYWVLYKGMKRIAYYEGCIFDLDGESVPECSFEKISNNKIICDFI